MCYYFHFYSLYTKLWLYNSETLIVHSIHFALNIDFRAFRFFLIFSSLHGRSGKPKITTEQKNKLNQICTRVTHSFPYIKFINLFWHRCFRSNKFNMKLCDVMHLHTAHSSDWHISKLSSRTHVMQPKKRNFTYVSATRLLSFIGERKKHFFIPVDGRCAQHKAAAEIQWIKLKR